VSRGRTQNIEREGMKDPDASAGAAERLKCSLFAHIAVVLIPCLFLQKKITVDSLYCIFVNLIMFCFCDRKYLCCLLLCMIFS